MKVRSLRIVSGEKTLADVLKKRFSARWVRVSEDAPDFTLETKLDPAMPKDVFSVERTSSRSMISAASLSELVCGTGRFLHESVYEKDGMIPWNGEGMFSLEKPFRGIYFAVHFKNFYHSAPVEEVCEYITDLALWGFNVFVFWYDLHHFRDFDDPESAAFRKRLTLFAETARSMGMKRTCLHAVNEAFADSPEAVRAQKENGIRGGWYDSQICPSLPAGKEYLRKQFENLCRNFYAELQLDYLCFWPYDQGGCGCGACAPWATKTYPELCVELEKILKSILPGCRTIVSAWMFSESEWNTLLDYWKNNPEFCEYLLEEFLQKPVAQPFLGFPEISMKGMYPWGGFGASVLARYQQQHWDSQKEFLQGGFPYSEGIFEDLSKVIYSQFYCWDSSASETMKKYIVYEFGLNDPVPVMKALSTLEDNHHIRTWNGLSELLTGKPSIMPVEPPQKDPGAEEAFALLQKMDAHLPEWGRNSWRWRIVFLRALLDARLKMNDGKPDELCEKAFDELTMLYHAQHAETTVSPPAKSRNNFWTSSL